MREYTWRRVAVHIPDGYLSPPWIVATYAVTLAYASVAWRRLRGRLREDQLMAATVLAAAVFAAQMLNWPLPGGTSLHFVGGALAGILFGPYLGFYTMAMVIVTQALLFHDGGILTLGANLFNMAIVDVLVGYTVYRLARGVLGSSGAAMLAGWAGITLAGLAAGVEIGLSPSFPYGVEITVPVMAGWHAVLGIIEGVITALVVSSLEKRGSPLLEAARAVNPLASWR